jgi:hypothetical protein
MADIGNELIRRMYMKGVCTNALSDWLCITKDELFGMLNSSGLLNRDEPAIVEIIAKSSARLSHEMHRCQYCGKPGKMYHIHHGFRSLCMGCLPDKLNFGSKRYEKYAWTNMSAEEIYSAFVNCYVGGFTAWSSGWEHCITADYIGTYKGVTEWYNWQDQSCAVLPGNFPRRGKRIIRNSNINIRQLTGVWHNRPVESEKMFVEFMEIFADGTGVYTDYKGKILKMNWYIDGVILNISMDDKFTFYRGPFYFRESETVMDVYGQAHIYPSWGWTEHDSAKHAIRGKYYKIR